jgi:hypothetical protein
MALTTIFVAQAQPGDVGGGGEGGGDLVAVAEVEVAADVVRHLVVKDRRTGAIGVGGLGDDRQRVDVDRHHFGRVPGEREGVGDHGSNRLADMPHPVRGQRVPRRAQHRGAVAIVHDLARRQRADAAHGQIGRGIDREDARHRSRRPRVDGADDAVRQMAPDHHRLGLARHADVRRHNAPRRAAAPGPRRAAPADRPQTFLRVPPIRDR